MPTSKKETIVFQPSIFRVKMSVLGRLYIMYKKIYLEPVNVLYFGGWTLQIKVFSNQNKGHLGSRYTYTPIWNCSPWTVSMKLWHENWESVSAGRVCLQANSKTRQPYRTWVMYHGKVRNLQFKRMWQFVHLKAPEHCCVCSSLYANISPSISKTKVKTHHHHRHHQQRVIFKNISAT